MRTAIIATAAMALMLFGGSAVNAQSLPASQWRTCADGNNACQAFCDQNKPGDRSCTGDCFGRMKQCVADGYYPWGKDGKNLIGPLTKTSAK